ncbi:uncharacterized protein LOC125237378 [Leguminivora glycinivorella]|uniref:uncharacterized protein LOC125237378 n=1 Tax=Leguminivora glycinivorella TaxID=1035111 RepID=UPI00200E6CEE|nr:uncharacterized protein LOC125237378 [Leguminivora glycinivorella]
MNELTENNVENCNAENSADSPPQRRRRSSFFERRSIVPEPSMNIIADDTNDEDADEEYLNQYYTQLRSEKDQWKKEVQNRRGILHDAELQLKMAKKSDKVRINYSILSNEDIEFLQAKPNLPDLVDSVRKLQKSTRETYELYKRAVELDEVVLRDVEGKVERVTKYLLEHSREVE